MRRHDVVLTWNHTKDHNRSRKLCFHHPGHVPVIRGNLRSRSLNIVSLSDRIEGSYRSWDLYTTGQLVDALQQKKENWFSLNRNGIMSSFLGWQFYRSIYILSYIYNLQNRNGEYLEKFSSENRLLCLNTKFQKRNKIYGLTPTPKILNRTFINKNSKWYIYKQEEDRQCFDPRSILFFWRNIFWSQNNLSKDPIEFT